MRKNLTLLAEEAGYEPMDVMAFRKGEEIRIFDYAGGSWIVPDSTPF